MKVVGFISGTLVLAALAAAQGVGLALPKEVAAYYTWTRANAQKNVEVSAHPLIKDVYLNRPPAKVKM